MIALPCVVRVGYVDYQIVPTYDSDGDKGKCDFDSRVIFVRDNLSQPERANTLLHEILHAAWEMGDLADGCAEEKIVNVLANQLTAIWRDNPEFVAFMNDALSIDTD